MSPHPSLHDLIGLQFIGPASEDKLTPGYYECLLSGADLMLRACGLECIPPLWWSSWSALEKRALADAGDRIRAETAFLSGVAGLGEAGAAMVAARFDGGRSLVRGRLNQLLDRMSQKAG